MLVDRRQFLRTSTVATGAFAFGPAFWQAALAAPATPGPGPYGPPGAADAATGLAVPNGFTVREVARGNVPVTGTAYPWHVFSDGSGCYAQPDGGWILASNSEFPGLPQGGASSITFDKDGKITGARRILDSTTMNCAGGVTPWGTWLSCEETGSGQVWECDPLGVEPAKARPAMGRFSHEAACVDAAGKQLYLTEDAGDGCFYRFTPKTYPDLSEGRLDVMLVDDAGKVTWKEIADPSGGGTPTRQQVPDAEKFIRGEGTWFDEGIVYFVTTTEARLYALNIADQTLEIVYDGTALGLQAELTGIDNVTVHPKSGDVFVSEDQDTDGSLNVGIITADRVASRFIIASGPQHAGSELTGPSFDPSGTRLYIASQRANQFGAVYEISGPFRQERPNPGGGGGGGGADTRKPAVTLRVLGKGRIKGVRRAGLPVAIRADEDVTAQVIVRRKRRDGKPGPVLARKTKALTAGTEVKLKLKPANLPNRKTIPISVTVKVADAAGNTATAKRNLRLR